MAMDFNLRSHTILLTIGGSRAYGIHTEESDVDVKGVAIPPLSYFLGYLRRFDQADKPSHMEAFIDLLSPELQAVVAKTKLEGSIYNLVKFAALAADANPNILDVLFCRDEEVMMATPAGEKLREARGMFLSAKAKHTFSGYAHSQLRRIQGHRKWLLDPPTHQPTRAEFGLPEKTLIPADHLAAVNAAVQKRMDQWEFDFSTLPKSEIVRIQGDIETFMTEFVAHLPEGMEVEDAKWLAAARSVGLDDNLIYVTQKEREYEAAHRHWKQFQHWKKSRNPARAALEQKFGLDTKHASHLVRLLRQGREILETGKVNVWRGDIDAEELLAIRNGEWSYDRLMEWAEAEDQKLQALYQAGEYVVPKQPDRNAIDALCIKIVEATQVLPTCKDD